MHGSCPWQKYLDLTEPLTDTDLFSEVATILSQEGVMAPYEGLDRELSCMIRAGQAIIESILEGTSEEYVESDNAPQGT